MERQIPLGACLLAAAVGASAASLDPPPGPRVTVGILLTRQHLLPDYEMRAMRHELDSILDLPRVRLEWGNLKEAAGRKVFDRIVVLQIDADDDGQEAKQWRKMKPSALAFSLVSDGEILPFATLNRSRVRSLLDSNPGCKETWRFPNLFGRALGRVLAHEVYHILARTTAHGYSGVSKPSLNAQDLITERLPLDPWSRTRIEEELFGGPAKLAANGRH